MARGAGNWTNEQAQPTDWRDGCTARGIGDTDPKTRSATVPKWPNFGRSCISCRRAETGRQRLFDFSGPGHSEMTRCGEARVTGLTDLPAQRASSVLPSRSFQSVFNLKSNGRCLANAADGNTLARAGKPVFPNSRHQSGQSNDIGSGTVEGIRRDGRIRVRRWKRHRRSPSPAGTVVHVGHRANGGVAGLRTGAASVVHAMPRCRLTS